MNSFSDLSLSPALARNLASSGFQTPTPIQAQSIPPAMEGRDVVATAQTGTGKTLAFLLPALERISQQQPATRGVQVLILTPTRELALQIQNEFRKLSPGTGLRSAVAVGGLNENPQIAAIRQGAQVLIATPGRLVDFLQRRLAKLDSVKTLILDEADRMLDMGFMPALEQILEYVPATRQTLLFSATIEQAVAHLVEKHVTDPVRIAIGSTRAPAEGINLRAYEVEHKSKVDLLHALLGTEQGSFLVFSRTKHGADRLAIKLSSFGVKAAAIHGDRSQNQRNQALRGFQDGYYRVLVATDVAARGIHVDGVAHVVNFDLPQVPEDFIHRVGRTGRAGRQGIASSFHTPSERGEIRRIERALSLKLERHARPEMPAAAAVPVAAPVVIPALERDVLRMPSRDEAPFGPKRDSRRPHAKPAGHERHEFRAAAPKPKAKPERFETARKKWASDDKPKPVAEQRGTIWGREWRRDREPGKSIESKTFEQKRFARKPWEQNPAFRTDEQSSRNGRPALGAKRAPSQGSSFRNGFGFSNVEDFAPRGKSRPVAGSFAGNGGFAGKKSGSKAGKPGPKAAQSGGWRKFGSAR